MRPNLFTVAVISSLAIAVFVPATTARAANDGPRLAKEIGPFWSCLSGRERSYSLSATAEFPIDGKLQRIDALLVRYDDESFDLDLKHPEYEVRVRRRPEVTEMALPRHGVAFVGRGSMEGDDHLSPAGFVARTLGPGTRLSHFAGLLAVSDPTPIAHTVLGFGDGRFDHEKSEWTAGSLAFRFSDEGKTLTFRDGETRSRVALAPAPSAAPGALETDTALRTVELDRNEIERQLSRGLRRACEVFAPSTLLTSPEERNRAVEHGELRWIGGQRVAILRGTPEQIGRAHGELLREEAARCIDSVLYGFGTVQTIVTGRWFRQDLDDAYGRLAPHIPEDHKRETRALAAALGQDQRLMETLNVFPELFHCSGFAAFGKATADGKLYHGRVLDYMTAIGLQDAATTFVVAVDGKIPFANVGYAGFVGSVSGMNAEAVSLGEMGGRGEGKWDGVPMATLMRRALEECSTLDEVMALWRSSPRTCEYYYVFADGKTRRAVGVAATPDSIEFVFPGQSHELLGPGIEDAVVLSAGDRLQCLRGRVAETHGRIDAELGQWLMSRPVAMESNLHNVLFVPEDGVFYVANADHQRPAAERPYVRLNLKELIGQKVASDR